MKRYDPEGFLFPYIRFFNASPQRGSMDFYIGNTLVASGIKFGRFTSYMKAGTGPQCYKATSTAIKDEVIDKICFEQNVGDVYTLCVTDKGQNAKITPIKESIQRDNLQYSHIRICNLCPQSSGYDVYANQRCILGDVSFGDVSRYMEIYDGTYDIKVMKKEKTVIKPTKAILEPGKFNTVYIIGIEDEIPYPTIELCTDAASYSGFYLQ